MATSSSARLRPRPGDILRYGFLFSDQSDGGREDPVKERPCVIVLAVAEGEHPTLMVAPITSRPPAEPDAIELSPAAFGGDRSSWILPWELNVFRWVGPDVAPSPRPAGAWWRIGALAPELRRRLADSVAARLAQRRARLVRRVE